MTYENVHWTPENVPTRLDKLVRILQHYSEAKVKAIHSIDTDVLRVEFDINHYHDSDTNRKMNELGFHCIGFNMDALENVFNMFIKYSI